MIKLLNIPVDEQVLCERTAFDVAGRCEKGLRQE